MTSTNFLTFDQGITLLIQVGLFMVFYFIYHLILGGKMYFTNGMLTTFIFALWLTAVTIFSNVVLALNFPLSRTSGLPFKDPGLHWKKY